MSKAVLLVSMTVLLLCTLGGCVPDYRPILFGTYLSASSDESVSAGESGLVFRIRIKRVHPKIFFEGTLAAGPYDYTVDRYGEIHVYNLTSGQYLNLYQCRTWYWDGETIIRASCDSDGTTTFMRQRAPQ